MTAAPAPASGAGGRSGRRPSCRARTHDRSGRSADPSARCPCARARARVAATRLPLESGQVDGPQHGRRRLIDRGRPRLVGEERRHGAPWCDAGVAGQARADSTDGRSHTRADDGLRGGAVGEPGTELIQVGRRCRRSSSGPGRAPDPRPSDAAPRSRSRSWRMRGRSSWAEPIGLVDDHRLAIEPGDPCPQEVVVEDRVVVLLRGR